MEDVVNRARLWPQRRVLVTGQTGFKGAWLALWLDRLGARVSGLALPPQTQPNLHDLLELSGRIDDAYGDIRDPAAVDAAFVRSRPEVVFHLAAQALVRASYAEPVETFATNVMGTVHVLEAARKHHVPVVVVVTSDKCYEQGGVPHRFREGDPLGGHDPYSASKAAAEIVAASYRRSYLSTDTILATVRAGNVIGGGDWSPDRIVTDVVAAVRTQTPIRLRYPHSVRPWQHVADALDGYLRVAERGLLGDTSVARAWNFAPLEPGSLTVEELAIALRRELHSDVPIVVESTVEPHETAVLTLDASDAAKYLGWTPRRDAAAAIAATGAWYREFFRGTPATELVEADLESRAPA
jgi:CDP-glucose 4,6-dehydratase